MLFKIGDDLIKLDEVISVIKCPLDYPRFFPFTQGFSSLLITFKNGTSIELGAKDDEEMDKWFNEISEASKLTFFGPVNDIDWNNQKGVKLNG
jgi:hypothetical protein